MKKKLNKFPQLLLVSSIALSLTGCLTDADAPAWIDPEINKVPTIDSTPELMAQPQAAYSYTFMASDGDTADTLTMSASVLPSWLTFDSASGVLSGTPSSADVGDHDVTITTSDGKDEVSQSFVITVAVASSGSEWTMVWSDEFDGTSLNTDNWNIQSGDGAEYGLTAWGNNEEQWYKGENITVADGNLIISAKEEPTSGYPYTSGRMRSDNKVDIKYGRIEARVKTPVGQGLWSAFWMLPTDSAYGGWASGGEIDIMEAVSPGVTDDVTYGTLHYGMPWPLNTSAGGNGDRTPIDEFHIYAIEWEQDEIRWFIDDVHYATVTSDTWWSYFYADDEQGYVSAPDAPFNQDFHLLFNLAVGGNWPGSPNDDTVFPAEMLVDYVRVYQCDSGEETGTGCANNINSTVVAPAAQSVFVASQTLFDDGISELSWELNGETVTRGLQVGVAWDNGGITVVEQDIGGDHGTVLDITTGDMGNIAISATDGEIFDLYGMGNSAEWWKLGAGEIKFDLYIDSAVTPNDSTISIKMDSVWPALGFKNLAVADLAKDTWISLSVPVNEFTANSGDQPLNTAAVNNLFIVEFSGAAHVQIDNIQVVCGHKNNNGCGIKAPAVEIDVEVLDVFIDSVNEETWTNGAGGWDNVVSSDYYTGDTANHVNWQLVDSGETGHDTVMEVTFNADGGDGVFYIQSAQPVDLSSFSGGNLIFDIKADTTGFTYKVDCISPCGTGDRVLNVNGDGEWQTITLAVDDLANQGLNLKSTNTGLVIFPTWGNQQGITFQLDNIRWQLGEDIPVDDTPVDDTPVDDTPSDGSAIDFEASAASYTFSDFDGGVASVIANPQSNGINTSAQVGQMLKGAGQTWGGSTMTFDTPVAIPENSVITMKVWSQRAVPVLVKFDDMNNEKTANHTGSGWEELSFDFSGSSSTGETRLTLIFENGVMGDVAGDAANWTFYFDDFTPPAAEAGDGGGEVVTGNFTAVGTPFDFEAGGLGADFTWAVFENVDNPALEFVANPGSSSVNDSAVVAQFTARQAGAAWAGTETAGGTPTFTMDATNSIVKIMVYKSVISDVGLKFSVGAAAQAELKVPNTKVNEWEELTFDFTSRIGTPETIGITSVIVFPDFDAGRASETVSYFDNITFGNITD